MQLFANYAGTDSVSSTTYISYFFTPLVSEVRINPLFIHFLKNF